MKNLKIVSLISVLFSLSGCGGGGGSESGTPAASSEPVTQTTQTETQTETEETETDLSTEDVLADPDASFKTSKTVNYDAYNDSDVNVTLYIYNRDNKAIARHYIKSGELSKVKLQVPTAHQIISVAWHYREFVQTEQLTLADLTSISFTGIE